MAGQNGRQLAQLLRDKMTEIKKLCGGLDEKTASSAPEGRWSPKEIISHLTGAEEGGFLPFLKLVLEQDSPRLDIVAEDPFFSDKRAAMSMTELLALCDKGYEDIAVFLEGLTGEQLGRRLYVPLFKDSPLTDHPSLGDFISGLAGYHLEYHINHMKEILGRLGVA